MGWIFRHKEGCFRGLKDLTLKAFVYILYFVLGEIKRQGE